LFTQFGVNESTLRRELFVPLSIEKLITLRFRKSYKKLENP
jgi:hypothetical protein